MNEKPKNEQKQLENESEFGKGLSYCLGLFLAHAERYGPHSREFVDKKTLEQLPMLFGAEMWFNAASDHLYELQVTSAPKYLWVRLIEFQSKCLRWGHGFDPEFRATDKDKQWAIEEAKYLLELIDQANNIPTKRGRWE